MPASELRKLEEVNFKREVNFNDHFILIMFFFIIARSQNHK